MSDYALNGDPEDAKSRARLHRTSDPLPRIPSTLLSSEHIQAYVAATAMIHPFHPDRPGGFKAASYEMRPGGKFIRWANGKKFVQEVSDLSSLELPANSISFVQLESEIRLPEYIAIRFNLRIQHVHRGLLLGTGPLVDPGFWGNLLVPLHNLTSDPYEISTEEGLIWIEFTKTSRFPEAEASKDEFRGLFKGTDLPKNERLIETHFEKANRNRPIESSIPTLISESAEKASDAQRAAKRAERTTTFFAGIGTLAALAIVISIFALLHDIFAGQRSAPEDAKKLEQTATAQKAVSDELLKRLEALQAEVARLSGEMERARPGR